MTLRITLEILLSSRLMFKINVNTSTISDCEVITLPKILTEKGAITAINNQSEVPFNISRVYYLYDVPGGAERGGHAHKELYQLIVAASGSFDVVIYDGKMKRTISLNRPYYGLLIVPGIWRELLNFSSGAICLVMASIKFDEEEYIRDYNNFLTIKKDGKAYLYSR